MAQPTELKIYDNSNSTEIPATSGPTWEDWEQQFTGPFRASNIETHLEGWVLTACIHPGYDEKTLVLCIDEVMPPEKPRRSLEDLNITLMDAVDLVHMLIGYIKARRKQEAQCAEQQR